MKDWLRYAKDRDGGWMRRTLAKTSTASPERRALMKIKIRLDQFNIASPSHGGGAILGVSVVIVVH